MSESQIGRLRFDRPGYVDDASGSSEEAGDPTAAGRIRLQDIDSARFQHAPEVEGLVAILAGDDSHAGVGARRG